MVRAEVARGIEILAGAVLELRPCVDVVGLRRWTGIHRRGPGKRQIGAVVVHRVCGVRLAFVHHVLAGDLRRCVDVQHGIGVRVHGLRRSVVDVRRRPELQIGAVVVGVVLAVLIDRIRVPIVRPKHRAAVIAVVLHRRVAAVEVGRVGRIDPCGETVVRIRHIEAGVVQIDVAVVDERLDIQRVVVHTDVTVRRVGAVVVRRLAPRGGGTDQEADCDKQALHRGTQHVLHCSRPSSDRRLSDRKAFVLASARLPTER